MSASPSDASPRISLTKSQQKGRTEKELITDAFRIFDPSFSGVVDVSNIGYIVRALKLNPTQAEVANIISNCVEADGMVTLEKFQEKMIPILQENKMKKDDEATIRRAFEVIDQEKRGYIETTKLAGLLASLGEPFAPHEIEELLSAAVQPEKGVIVYEDFAKILARG